MVETATRSPRFPRWLRWTIVLFAVVDVILAGFVVVRIVDRAVEVPRLPTPTVTAPVDAPAVPPVTVLDNPFLPEERNLSDCVSAIPKPGCGSEARGGWRQTLVFGVLVLGLAFIGWRIVRSARQARLRA